MNKSIIREAAARYPHAAAQPYSAMLDMDGFDAICIFSERLKGASTYVPSIKTIFGGCLEQAAVNDFDGCNYKELSEKYGFSERHIRRILKNRP